MAITSSAFKDKAILILYGNTKIENCNFFGRGMITQLGGNIEILNSKFYGLEEIPTARFNWSGGLNTINTNKVYIDNVVFSNIEKSNLQVHLKDVKTIIRGWLID